MSEQKPKPEWEKVHDERYVLSIGSGLGYVSFEVWLSRHSANRPWSATRYGILSSYTQMFETLEEAQAFAERELVAHHGPVADAVNKIRGLEPLEWITEGWPSDPSEKVIVAFMWRGELTYQIATFEDDGDGVFAADEHGDDIFDDDTMYAWARIPGPPDKMGIWGDNPEWQIEGERRSGRQLVERDWGGS